MKARSLPAPRPHEAFPSEQPGLAGFLAALEARVTHEDQRIRALVEEAGRFDRLQREAQELLRRFPAGGDRPPLLGLLVGVKDIFQVEGLPTRAGSRLPPSELEGPEGDCVARLKAAGALVLGKTVSTEFAFFAPGPTRNPRALRHTPGGSSSGSAAAVAAGLCPLALGTQTIGSISRPASFCGVVGFKPSYDRIPREGVLPLSPSLDHVGLLAASTSGAAAAARLVCRDWRQADPAGRPVLGVPEGPYLARASAEALAHFRRVCEGLERAGYEILRQPLFTDLEEIEARHWLILAAEAARVHAQRFARFSDLYHPTTADLIDRGRQVSDRDLAAALPGMRSLREQVVELMTDRGIDLWISPAAVGPAPRGLESTGDPVMSLPWTHCGLPTLSLPSGTGPSGLPLGLQVASRWWHDEALMAWSEELEEVLADVD